MPYCPQCRIEYVDGINQCDDCGTTLLPGSPPEPPPAADFQLDKNVKLVPVRIFAGGTAQMDADLARNILQTQGIASLVQGESAAEMLPVLDVPLLVGEQDLAHAEQVLKDYFDTPVEIVPDEAAPGEGK